ncbi:hypothetical protein BD309DRAFT_1021422 [Dichomitus squalens]|nr:hypothetical protein BD309DRAFT_1021422 [Dichomitus squalens]
MPTLYWEGERASRRLLEEILRNVYISQPERVTTQSEGALHDHAITVEYRHTLEDKNYGQELRIEACAKLSRRTLDSVEEIEADLWYCSSGKQTKSVGIFGINGDADVRGVRVGLTEPQPSSS